MADLTGFNAREVEPNTGFDPVPEGKYLCVINNSEKKPTKNGDGAYLKLELEIIDGQFKGRKLWDRLTIEHPNEMTVRIAKGSLSSICRAVNVLEPRDSIELHNLPLIVSVGLKKREDNGEMTNRIKGYASRNAASAPAAAPVTAGGKPPWAR